MNRHRIIMYSHDSYGLGHFQRSFTIASYLTRNLKATTALMLTGLDSAASFRTSRGVDTVKLPSIWKSDRDEYRARHLRVSFQRVRRLRSSMIRNVARSFYPHLVIVDNVPRGVDGELLGTLRYLRERRPETKVVLTLRDIVDDAGVVRADWEKREVFSVLRDMYDEIWVAGDQQLYDPLTEYGFPDDVAAKTRFCGHVVRGASGLDPSLLRRELGLDDSPVVVASCGGGGDGAEVMSAYVDAAAHLARVGVRSICFLGPDMPTEVRSGLVQKARELGNMVHCFDYRADFPDFLELADVCVSMGGYNTICETAAFGRPAVVVPRVEPRLEQLIRCELLEKHGLLTTIHPKKLSADRLANAVLQKLQQKDEETSPSYVFEASGLRCITRRVRKLLYSEDVRREVAGG